MIASLARVEEATSTRFDRTCGYVAACLSVGVLRADGGEPESQGEELSGGVVGTGEMRRVA